MKQKIAFFTLLLICLFTVSVFAGSYPEDILHDDNSVIYFGQLVKYDRHLKNSTVQLLPLQKIKGNVTFGKALKYTDPYNLEKYDFRIGSIYLVAADRNGNYAFLFETDGFDPRTLSFTRDESGQMYRLKDYLNNGQVEQEERRRIDFKNKKLTPTGQTLTLTQYIETQASIPTQITLSFGNATCQVDKKSFLAVADHIILTQTGVTTAEQGQLLCISSAECEILATISPDCKVRQKTGGLSRFIIKAEDLQKLMALLPAEQLIPVADPLPKPPVSPLLPCILAAVVLLILILLIYRHHRRNK